VGHGSVVDGNMASAVSYSVVGPVPRSVAQRSCDCTERCLCEGIAESKHLVLAMLFGPRQWLGPVRSRL